MLTQKFKHYSRDLLQRDLHRKRCVSSYSKGACIHFSSNDYLSLASDESIKKAYQQGFKRYPSGSGGSMVVCGYHSTHKALEDAFADALGVEDCLLFPSGYAANLSVVGLLACFDAHLLIDKAVHASIYDGLKLSGGRYSRYLHNDLTDLAKKMRNVPLNSVIMTEGVFSMSGPCAELFEIVEMGRAYQHVLLVDEAHSFGLLGPEGLGAVVQQQLTEADVPLRIIPLGKACAGFGAIVAGKEEWIDALLQSARPHIYSTAISPAYAHGLLETLAVIRSADARRAKLAALVDYFREAISNSPLQWRDSSSPIQQLQLGCPEQALLYADKLRSRSIICAPMRYPTVSRQETGLRVILNYDHQPEDIDALFKCLHQL